MIKTLRNKKGVTLVELLAVVVILGIIAAIAVPTIGGLIERQQEKADELTLENVISAAKLYASSEDVDVFTLQTLDGSDYLDLGTNTLGFTTETDSSTTLYFEVAGSTVELYNGDPDDSGTLLTVLFVNATEFESTDGIEFSIAE